jgi:hypothetical protein
VARAPLASHAKIRAKHGLTVLLGSDPGDVTEAYGTWVEKSMYGKKYMGIERATFLIGRDGKIAEVWGKVKVPGHAEAVRIVYDADIISYAELLDIFFHTHDPTTLNRQGGDTGTQYRSAIFPQNGVQAGEAEAAIARNQASWDNPIVTTIEPNAPWWPAEAYHQR